MNASGKEAKISPCALRLLTPALSSFGEEREKAGATFVVQGRNARMAWGIFIPTLSPTSAERETKRRPGAVHGPGARFEIVEAPRDQLVRR